MEKIKFVMTDTERRCPILADVRWKEREFP